MWMKNKTFDCVEMKNRIQAERYAEYLAHKDEYGTFLDFINARVEKSENRAEDDCPVPDARNRERRHAPEQLPEP